MKNILLTATAGMAIIATPAVAQDNSDYVELVTNAATAVGIDAASSTAVAVTLADQRQDGTYVNYREQAEMDAANGYVDPVFGPGWRNGEREDQIAAGYFAPIVNTIDTIDVAGSGNIGVNLAAGYFNDQMNATTIAQSSPTNESDYGGWAVAANFATQEQYDVSQSAGEYNFRDRNTIHGANVSGSGNIGVNAAAGTLNQQANLTTLAVADDSTLALAYTDLAQFTSGSYTEQQDSVNHIYGLNIDGAEGNVGVNFAAGVGNQQMNSLTIASSQGATPTN